MIFASATLAAALTAATLTAALPLGSAAPESQVKMKNAASVGAKPGKAVSIADVAGKAGTLVVFTCDHCPFARGWESRIVDLANAYSKKGIGVVLINANDPAQHDEDGFAGMQARAKSAGMQIPYVVDETSAVARAFGATVTPEAFLFDAHGKLVYHGTVDDNLKQPDQAQKHYLKDALEAVAGGPGDQEPRLQHQVPGAFLGPARRPGQVANRTPAGSSQLPPPPSQDSRLAPPRLL
jgi:peroxiredoxin